VDLPRLPNGALVLQMSSGSGVRIRSIAKCLVYSVHVPVIKTEVAFDPDHQIVLVIDTQHAWAVYKALGDAMQPPSAPVVALRPRTEPASLGINVQDNGLWTEDMVRQLAAELWRPEVRAALTVMAVAGGKPVTFSALVEATGEKAMKLRAGLASLSKTTYALFGRKTLPMLARQGLAGGTETAYRMPETIGQWWLAAWRATGGHERDLANNS
jgi:hypothetical protein